MDEAGVGLTTDELFAAALLEVAADADADSDDDEWRPMPFLIALTGRPTREVFARAAQLLARDGYVERELGARILRELGPYDDEGRRPLAEETIGVLMAEMADEPDPGILGWMISGLGYHRGRRALDLVLGYQDHPAQPVRFGVAAALPGLADPERTEPRVVEALLRLAVDQSGAVRWYALYALFNETAAVDAERRRLWAAQLSGRADDAERREELRRIAEPLQEQADPALRDLLVRDAGH
ncbi:hypothetical protein KME66_00095 [Streptomyces sp. YPW6]|uniref:HEAT repeat domain-containing protein n=1 Tax=Streptomyces sp. YPW6 TaxID=2840373 RepID=UPI001C0CE1D9|nr:HEAT repeat domain-containing protein [Streptomyces sp. YPW6]QWQ39590.1 hypothetical protein KME66_00095 [Streptomyces sp. YPW6]